MNLWKETIILKSFTLPKGIGFRDDGGGVGAGIELDLRVTKAKGETTSPSG
jgi:hypothetical protein